MDPPHPGGAPSHRWGEGVVSMVRGSDAASVLETTPTAVLFPGQGSQVPGMRDAVASARPDLLEAVVALVGDDPFERIDESTRFAQPAILCASLAGWARVRDQVAVADRLRRPLARRADRPRGGRRARGARRAAPRRPARPAHGRVRRGERRRHDARPARRRARPGGGPRRRVRRRGRQRQRPRPDRPLGRVRRPARRAHEGARRRAARDPARRQRRLSLPPDGGCRRAVSRGARRGADARAERRRVLVLERAARSSILPASSPTRSSRPCCGARR